MWETTHELYLDSFFTGTEELLVQLFCLDSGLGGKVSWLRVTRPCGSLKNLLQCICVVSGIAGKSAVLLGTKSKLCYQQQFLLSALVSSHKTQGNAICVGVFPRNTGQRHGGCVSLEVVHLTCCVGRTLRPTVGASALDVETNNFNAVFVFVIVELSSDFGCNGVTFII